MSKKEEETSEAELEEKAKPEKGPKPEKKRKEEKGIFSLYKLEKETAIRLRPTCERCGPGYFMADHGNRYTCGHCGFTRYKPVEKK
ncbi:MAG: 30S ribosomal protein S27ae [Candidatus Bathyarchaeota archaeon]|nr:30S ribosomal protein S27ae [Candidatus Bathyarchaeota archaeon]MDH5788196.1 30S ribosomal protein S27ae [Candidatus Bathyarchaeota archaeon]